MPYSNFTLAKAREAFGLTLNENRSLFEDVVGVQPSDLLKQILDENLSLATAINSEKARSEFLIAPILSEVRRQLDYQISLFSGTEFNVNPAIELLGFCDFILSASREQYFITALVVTVVEAKNENIIGGWVNVSPQWLLPKYSIKGQEMTSTLSTEPSLAAPLGDSLPSTTPQFALTPLSTTSRKPIKY